MKKRERISYDSVHDFEGPIEDVIARLQQTKAELETKGYEDITLSVEDQWGYYDDHWIEIAYYGVKPVTVKEFLESDDTVIHAKHLKRKK